MDNGLNTATYQMAFLGIGLGVIGVFVGTGILPAVQAGQFIITHMLQALGVG